MSTILSWFVKDIAYLRRQGDAALVTLKQARDPYRPPGLYCITRPSPGRPVLWRFPQPLHPIEAIAAVRGFEGEVMYVANARAGTWLEYTAFLSRTLFVTPETLRLVWHALTPLDVPTDPRDTRLDHARAQLWSAAGFPGWEWHDALWDSWSPERKYHRPRFWTDETKGGTCCDHRDLGCARTGLRLRVFDSLPVDPASVR